MQLRLMHVRMPPVARALLLPPLAAIFLYLLWQWGIHLGNTVFSDDRYFHTMALLEGVHNETEPLWGMIAPAIGDVFPEYAFEAASLITLILIAGGLWLNRLPWPAFFLISFSPGVSYLLTNALRQGMAIGAFLVLIGLARRWMETRGTATWDVPYRWWMPLVFAIPTGLIHNAMAIVALYMAFSYWIRRQSAYGRRSQYLQLALAAAGATLYWLASEGFISGHLGASGVGGTGGALLLAIPLILVSSLFTKQMRSAVVPMVTAFLLAIAGGFILTTTGLRVLIMVSLVTPITLPKKGSLLTIAGCWIYPVFLLVLGAETENLVPVM